jgi:hypothetical protein
MKLSYHEMIEDAILTLADRQGSTRLEIWKCVHSKYPEADYKQFLVRMKKVDPKIIVRAAKGQKWRLDPNYRARLLTALKNGKSPATAKKQTPASIKKNKNKKRVSSKRPSTKKTQKNKKK